MKYVKGYLIIFGISMLVAFGVYFYLPNYRNYLYQEDNLIENLSVAFFLLSFFIGLIFFIKSKMRQKALIYIAAVGLLGCMEELSFGERLFSLRAPQIHGKKIDAVHDFLDLGYMAIEGLTYPYPIYIYLLLAGGFIIVTAIVLKYRHRLKKMISSIRHKPPFTFAFFFTILILFALVIDLDIIQNSILVMVEELFEMNAAVALLFCCLSLYPVPHPS